MVMYCMQPISMSYLSGLGDSYGMKDLFNLVLKARHLGSSAIGSVDIHVDLPEQAVRWFPPRFGIGCGRWTY